MQLSESIKKIKNDLSSITQEQRVKILEIFENEPIILFEKEINSSRDLVDSLIAFSENNHFVKWKIFQAKGYYKQAIKEYEKTLDNPDYSGKNQQNAYLGIWICSIKLHQYSKALESFNIAENWDDEYLSREASSNLKILNGFLGEDTRATRKMLFN